MNKQELMKEVRERSDIGISYAKMQLDFIKWLAKKGKIIK